MATVGTDKRKAEWTLKSDLVSDIARCFRSESALVSALDTNTNTWKKIREGDFVKKTVARELYEEFLSFLEKFHKGDSQIDTSKHYERHIQSAVETYVVRYLDEDAVLVRKQPT